MRPFWNIHAVSWEEKYMYFKFTSREAWHLGQKSLGTKLQTSSGNLVPLNLTWGNSNSLLTPPPCRTPRAFRVFVALFSWLLSDGALSKSCSWRQNPPVTPVLRLVKWDRICLARRFYTWHLFKTLYIFITIPWINSIYYLNGKEPSKNYTLDYSQESLFQECVN